MRAPHRRRPMIRAIGAPPPGTDLDTLANRVSYVGSPEHKDAPSFAGHPRPRGDASICDRQLSREKVTTWLQEAIRTGSFGSYWEGAFPRYVWYKDETVVYEGRLVNCDQGSYKGFPLEGQTSGRSALSRSMANLRFDFHWEDPLEARVTELRATWAQLRILVDDEPVTKVYDDTSRTVRDSLYLPLYPLAEWFATHWWILWNELGTPDRRREPAYRLRHSLRDAREGYALPNLDIHSLGDAVRLTWEPQRLPYHRLEFLGGGFAELPLDVVVGAVKDLISAVVGRLADYMPETNTRSQLKRSPTLLEQEWAAILAADDDEKQFCEAAGTLGLDPYVLDDQGRATLLGSSTILPSSIQKDLFSVANFNELPLESERTLAALGTCRANTANLQVLKDLRNDGLRQTLVEHELPWRQGYAFARAFRQELGLSPSQPLRSLAALAAALHVPEAELHEAVRTSPLPRATSVAMDCNTQDSPGFAMRAGREHARMFHLSRAPFEALTAPTPTALLTNASSSRQRRNRAFAAEFLAPAKALQERFSDRAIITDDIDEVAEEFGVSTFLIEHQLENHGIATVPRDSLSEE